MILFAISKADDEMVESDFVREEENGIVEFDFAADKKKTG